MLTEKNIAYYLYTPLRDDSMHTLYCDRLIFLSLKKLCEGIITVSNRLDIKYLLEVNIAPSLDCISVFHSFNDMQIQAIILRLFCIGAASRHKNKEC